MNISNLNNCKVCPRNCGADRHSGKNGYCREPEAVFLARAALHYWEEPCISGRDGSGAVFFSGCNLRCVFCQNGQISGGEVGKEVSTKRLAEIFLELQEKGANNINLVTPTHYSLQIRDVLSELKAKDALKIPVVWNSSGYDLPETLRQLEGLVQIWMPDFKYVTPDLAEKYSHADDYPERARSAIREMFRQAGPTVYDENGIMKKGVLVRHLVLPCHTKEAMKVVQELYETYGDEIAISIMHQYTPMPWIAERMPELNRKVTRREYEKVLNYALDLGVTNGFTQDGKTAQESFIPAFDYECVSGKE